jgi:hypothetical protein
MVGRTISSTLASDQQRGCQVIKRLWIDAGFFGTERSVGFCPREHHTGEGSQCTPARLSSRKPILDVVLVLTSRWAGLMSCVLRRSEADHVAGPVCPLFGLRAPVRQGITVNDVKARPPQKIVLMHHLHRSNSCAGL